MFPGVRRGCDFLAGARSAIALHASWVCPPRSCEEVMIVKTGMADRRKVGLACGLIAIAVALTIRWVDSGFVQKGEMNGNGVLRPSAGSSRAPVSKTWVDPMLNIGALRASEAARYEGSGRDIFHVALDLPPHRKTEKWDPEKNVTRHEETVTPFPLTFFGFSRRGDARSIFLLAGDDVFIAREGDVVDRRYKIVRVTPKSVEVEDLMKQETQKLWLKDG
jgi:diadenosine tetraphosphatase ApaH/serine/threonine PP2A family protein phosphatase